MIDIARGSITEPQKLAPFTDEAVLSSRSGDLLSGCDANLARLNERPAMRGIQEPLTERARYM